MRSHALNVCNRFLVTAAIAVLLLASAAVVHGSAAESASAGSRATAVFAGGCFWCLEQAFDEVAGVVSTTSGYTGGKKANPTYQQVSAGGTGHVEAVKVVYDPSKVGYEGLLDAFWRNVDPTDDGGQFCDRGSQYRSVIFYGSDGERQLAEASRAQVAAKLHTSVATLIVPAAPFHVAEDYHQDYYKKNPLQYRFYKWNCGREQRLTELWDGE